MLQTVLVSASVMGGLGVLFALGLAFAAGKFRVDSDPRVDLLSSALPGANCGGCGYSGCQGYAEALVEGNASLNACRACSNDTLNQISQILGKEMPAGSKRQVARVLCGGNYKLAKWLAQYEGAQDCRAAVMIGSSPKGCSDGCLGLGSCTQVCPFHAIKLGEDHLPVVAEDKCTGCGICARTCPREVIQIMDFDQPVYVRCNSHNRGRAVKDLCQVGCLGCKACEKVCEQEAIKVIDNLAIIDADKCSGCGACAAKCPSGCIIITGITPKEKSLPA